MTCIIIVLPKLEEGIKIKNLLVRRGYQSVSVCSSGAQAISTADQYDDGIIVCGYHLADMMYSELKENMPPGFEMLLLASEHILPECDLTDIMALSMPLKIVDFIDTLNMMGDNIAMKRKKRHEKPKSRSLEELELISKAKKLLMERNHMTEDEAHKYIQKNSMCSGVDLVETARMVLTLYAG